MKKDKLPEFHQFILDHEEARRRHIGGAANKLNYWRKILSSPTVVPPTHEIIHPPKDDRPPKKDKPPMGPDRIPPRREPPRPPRNSR